MSNPLVSVVMPIYNAEPYLREALDSVSKQTLRDLEIVCVNDGSTDTSLATIQEYAVCDPRIVIVDGPNGGYGVAMNKGIDAATGRYLGILEPDDFLEPDMMQTLADAMAADKLDFVRSDYHYFRVGSDGEKQMGTRDVAFRAEDYAGVLSPSQDYQLFNNRMENWTGLYDLAWLREHGIRFHESPGAAFQDNGFWFQTYCWARRIRYVHRPFYCYRVDNAASSINSPNKAFAMLDEYAWIHTWLSRHTELPRELFGVLQYKKTHNCLFALSRLAPEMQPPYLERYAREYRDADVLGELDRKYFGNAEWRSLRLAMRDPEGWLRRYRRQDRQPDFAFDE